MHDGTVAIRRAREADRAPLLDVAVASGVLDRAEAEGFGNVIDGSGGPGGSEPTVWLVAEGAGRVVGAAYAAPEPFADRVWNLYFLAVAPEQQGRSIGSRLVASVEQRLLDAGEGVARVLLVETSSTGDFAAARAFYDARGFTRRLESASTTGPATTRSSSGSFSAGSSNRRNRQAVA